MNKTEYFKGKINELETKEQEYKRYAQGHK